MLYSYADYERKPMLATEKLGSLLREGCLALFLGAGVSSGFGLPEWKALVARVVDKEDDAEFVKTLASMGEREQARLIDEVDDGTVGYATRVYKALYRDVKSDLMEQLPRSPLLLAVAALITGSCRGRVAAVTTYNFDDLLEQYLSMLGYAVCVRTRPDQLSTRADVEINHPHGLLPQSWDRVSKPQGLVLSEKSYRERRSEIDKGWSAGIEHGLFLKIGLFLGLSGDDSSILDVLKRSRKEIQRSEDYCGYWLMTPTAFSRNAKSIRDVGMCPIRVDREDMASFVLRICQKAAAP